MTKLDYDALISKGWTKAQDGSLNAPRKRGAGGKVEARCAEHAPLSPLEFRIEKQPESARSVERCHYVVSVVQLRKRLLDAHDSLPFAVKPLVDAIADTLELDDANERIRWQYGQVETRGEECCIVRIEQFNERIAP